MSEPQLLLTPVTTQAIRGLVSRGHVHPIPHETLYLRKVKREEYRLCVPHGYIIHFDVGHYKPKWQCRHLTVQGPGKWPGVLETRKLMRLTGFKGDLEGVCTWADRSAPRHVVHLLEPLDGNYGPLQSS